MSSFEKEVQFAFEWLNSLDAVMSGIAKEKGSTYSQRETNTLRQFRDIHEKAVKERDALKAELDKVRGTFPILDKGAGFIPMSVARKVYEAYVKKYGTQQSIERMAERGGFSKSECDMLYPDWRKEVLELDALKAENERLKTALINLMDVAGEYCHDEYIADAVNSGEKALEGGELNE